MSSSAVESRFECLAEVFSQHLGVLATIVEEQSETLPEDRERWVHVTPSQIQTGWIPFMGVVQRLQAGLGLNARLEAARLQLIAEAIWLALHRKCGDPAIFPGAVQGVFFLAEPCEDRSPGRLTVHYYCDQPI